MEKPESSSKGRLQKKWAILFKAVGILILLILLFQLGFAFYVSAYKEDFKNEIVHRFNENSSGRLIVGDLSVSFFKGFPNLQISMDQVILRDSLWDTHHKDFLKADHIYSEIRPWMLFRKQIDLTDCTLKNVSVNLYKSATGYSNTSIFKKKKTIDSKATGTSKLNFKIKNIELKNLDFFAQDLTKSKLFHFQNCNAAVGLKFSGKNFLGNLKIETFIKEMNFNTLKGSYAKNKLMKGSFRFWFDAAKDQFDVESNAFHLGPNLFECRGRFGASSSNTDFFINLYSKSIYWKNASALVAPNISKKTDNFNLEKPFAIDCYLKGNYRVRGEPKIHIKAEVKANLLQIQEKQITNCSFTGVFINNYIAEDFYDDLNTAILLNDFKGSFNGLPFGTKNLKVFNLKRPEISGFVHSDFDVAVLNNVFNSKVFKFDSGAGNFQVNFQADLVNLKLKKPKITGKVVVKNAHFEYLPKHLSFKKNDFEMEFTSDKLLVKNLKIRTLNNDITMHGYSENFLNFLYDSPEKIILNWEISAKKLNLEDFMYILKNEAPHRHHPKRIAALSKNDFFSKATELSQSQLKIKIDELQYKRFWVHHILADIHLNQNRIILNEVFMNQGNGTILLKGTVNPADQNRFNLTSDIRNLDLKKFYYAFNNFNSKKITYKNLEGKTNLKAKLSGRIRKDGTLIQQSLNGNLNFDIYNGKFIDFEPIQKIGKILFPQRKFDRITFETLHGDFDIHNGLVKIKPMPINTSVMNFDLAGDYSLSKGTDLQMDVHLRNPEKDKDISDPALLKQRRAKGVTIHLQATEDMEGNMKIKIRSNNEKLDRID